MKQWFRKLCYAYVFLHVWKDLFWTINFEHTFSLISWFNYDGKENMQEIPWTVHNIWNLNIAIKIKKMK